MWYERIICMSSVYARYTIFFDVFLYAPKQQNHAQPLKATGKPNIIHDLRTWAGYVRAQFGKVSRVQIGLARWKTTPISIWRRAMIASRATGNRCTTSFYALRYILEFRNVVHSSNDSHCSQRNRPATMTFWASLITWIIWLPCCWSNYRTATNYRCPGCSNPPHLAKNSYSARTYSINYTNGAKQREG